MEEGFGTDLTRIVCQMVKRAMLADDTAGVQSAT